MKPPYRKTPTARAAAACCALWHNPKALNNLIFQINFFYLNTKRDVL